MPANKDFKRLVRGRMQKTGESYTTARAHLLKQKPAAPAAARPSTARPAAVDYARLAGRSDAIIKEKTGCTWERWVKALDYAQAYTWTHREIAQHVHEKYKVPGWWAQSVTVGYERIKGMRAVGQRRDGPAWTSRSGPPRAGSRCGSPGRTGRRSRWASRAAAPGRARSRSSTRSWRTGPRRRG
jgi:hypothetical protein